MFEVSQKPRDFALQPEPCTTKMTLLHPPQQNSTNNSISCHFYTILTRSPNGLFQWVQFSGLVLDPHTSRRRTVPLQVSNPC